jgi:hypothetical protein
MSPGVGAGFLFQSRKLEVSHDPGENWLYARWMGRQSARDIREGGRAMLQAMAEVALRHRCGRVLNDNREVVGSWSHSLQWAASEWLPQMRDAGLRRFAWVLSPDGFAALSSLRMTTTAGAAGAETIRTFSDLHEAQDWLRRQR